MVVVVQPRETAEVIRRFNQAFHEHDPAILEDLVAPDCVMESIQPAPNGTRYDVNLAFWQDLAADRVNRFEVKDTFAMGDRANIRWRFHFGDGGSVRGVTLIRVRTDGSLRPCLMPRRPASRRPCRSNPRQGQGKRESEASSFFLFNRSPVHHRPRACDRQQ